MLSKIPLEYSKADIALQLIVDIALEAVSEVVEVAVQGGSYFDINRLR